MEHLVAVTFDIPRIGTALDRMQQHELDELDFGVIGFDAGGLVCAYNIHESEAAGLGAARVLAKSLFVEVAPCMNNFLVAERFRVAAADRSVLDDTIDYVLTLRMRPTRVRLRLVMEPDADRAYVLVQRLAKR